MPEEDPCPEILSQIATLTANLTAIDTSISSQVAAANSYYNGFIAGDTFGGTYCTQPLTTAKVQARYDYLYALKTPYVPTPLLVSYATLKEMEIVIDGLIATRTQIVAQLGNFQQQAIENNCQQ